MKNGFISSKHMDTIHRLTSLQSSYNDMTSNMIDEFLFSESNFDDGELIREDGVETYPAYENMKPGFIEVKSDFWTEAQALLQDSLNLTSWSDDSDCETVVKVSEPESEWIEVTKAPIAETSVRFVPWCRRGNACEWGDCKFRHERCEHYDKWVSTRGKTRMCRHQNTDLDNCKSPEEGGCKYDHRDLSKLRLFSDDLACSTEYDFLKNFGPMGVEQLPGTMWDTSFMTAADRKIMIRSLDAAKIEYDLSDTWLSIYFNN